MLIISGLSVLAIAAGAGCWLLGRYQSACYQLEICAHNEQLARDNARLLVRMAHLERLLAVQPPRVDAAQCARNLLDSDRPALLLDLDLRQQEHRENCPTVELPAITQ